MRHWSQLATRNWQGRRLRTLGAVVAIALGTAAVVWVTCCYESIRRTVMDWASGYVGNAHVMVSSPLGRMGQIPERLLPKLANMPNVAAAAPTLIQRLHAVGWPAGAEGERPKRWDDSTPEVDFYGIDLAVEPLLRDHAAKLREGRMITPEDRLAVIIDIGAKEELKIKVGDSLLVWNDIQETPFEVKVVGMFERRRLVNYQKPLAFMNLQPLQEMRSKSNLVTSIELMLKNAERDDVIRAVSQARVHARSIGANANVRSAEQRMKQIETAQDQQQLVLVLLSSVAMLTALFIILSTLSMGMVERIVQLGLLRCIGVTRWQLAALVLFEVMPLGVLGIAAGVPTGLGLAALTVVLVPEYVGSFALSWTGIGQAVAAGLLTTLLAAVLPAIAALRVSPMEAARPRARRPASFLLVLVAVLALAVLAGQVSLMLEIERAPGFVQVASLGVVLLYLGYAMLAPMIVRAIGAPAVLAAAAMMRVRARLLQDQVGHAVWRSAGICCGLMVGLSLIVGILVVNESVTTGWQFPKKFPEAFVWTPERVNPPGANDVIAAVPGVRDHVIANLLNVSVEEQLGFLSPAISMTWFLGCDPDQFLGAIGVEFVEGDAKTAREKLREGGHILIAEDFSRSRNKHVGDEVKIYYGTTAMRRFKVAGVIQSPALDIAASYFQAHTEYNVVAAGSVMGTLRDLKQTFGIEGLALVLLNLDLKPEPVPADWPPKGLTEDEKKEAGLKALHYDERYPLDVRWRQYRESNVLRAVRTAIGAPKANFGTVRELKDDIDRQLTDMTRLMTAVPSVALLVAAIGVANLMTANVASRTRQLAIMRAVGATRGMILRMIIGEALVLGLLGTGLGLALGVHLATNITALIDRMWGLRMDITLPWPFLAMCAVLTVGLCVVAGIFPARHASRSNVVDALHVR